jgi:hypothetical protein
MASVFPANSLIGLAWIGEKKRLAFVARNQAERAPLKFFRFKLNREDYILCFVVLPEAKPAFTFAESAPEPRKSLIRFCRC